MSLFAADQGHEPDVCVSYDRAGPENSAGQRVCRVHCVVVPQPQHRAKQHVHGGL